MTPRGSTRAGIRYHSVSDKAVEPEIKTKIEAHLYWSMLWVFLIKDREQILSDEALKSRFQLLKSYLVGSKRERS